MNELISKSLQTQTTGKQIIGCPFPGLRPFKTNESPFFFGRESTLQQLINNLAEKRLIAVIGESGSGKTSILNAGLIADFEKKTQDSDKNWITISFYPSGTPVKSLAKALSKKIHFKEKEIANEKAIEEMLCRNETGLVDVISSGLKPNESLLLVIDQFEEICRIESNSGIESPEYFINLLINAYNNRNIPIFIAIGVRSEFLERCSQTFGINQILNTNSFQLPDFTTDELRDIITLPVITAGGNIDSQVVNQIISDSKNIRNKLPKIQFTLKEIWSHSYKQNTKQVSISISDYNSAGAINSLPNKINFSYERLQSEEKRHCEKILKSIVTKYDGIYISNSLKISEISEITRIPIEKIIELADKLRMPDSPIFLPPSDVILTSATELQISHESLPYIWNTLGNWIDEEAASVILYKDLAKEAEIFQASRSELLKPPALFKFLEWEKKQQPNIAWAKRHNPAFERTILFLRRSEQEYRKEEERKLKQQRQRKNRKILLLIIIISALIAFLGVAAVKISDSFNKQHTEKVKNFKIKNSVLNKNNLGIQVKYNTLKKKPDTGNLNIKEKEIDAIKSGTQPAEIDEETYIKKLLVKADTLASLSLQIKDDKYLKGLLAYYAFSFYNRYGETEYNNRIYNAMNEAIKVLYGDYYNVFKGHTDAVNALTYYPNKHIFYSAASDGRVAEWRTDDKLKRPKLISSENTIMQSACISNNGRWLVCASSKLPLQIFDTNDTNIEAEYFKGPSVNVMCLAFWPDNKHFLSAGNDKTITIWDIETGSFKKFADAGAKVIALCIDSAGSGVVAGTEDGKLLYYDVAENESYTIEENNDDPITAIGISKDGKYMATGSKSGNIVLWDYLNRNLITTLNGHTARITDIKFNPASDAFISTAFDNKVLLWPIDDYTNGPVMVEEHDSPVLSVSFSSDGNTIVIGSVNENRIVIDPVNPQYMASMISRKMVRNLSRQEWDSLIGKDIAYEKISIKK